MSRYVDKYTPQCWHFRICQRFTGVLFLPCYNAVGWVTVRPSNV